MKVVAKPIEVVSYTNVNGEIRPVRFRLINEDETFTVIKIDKIIVKDIEKLAGNIMYVYKCQSLVDGIQKMYEIKYELRTCKWILFKI